MIFLLAFFLLFPSFAQATTYYIAPTGSDANDGLTPSAPFLTFAYAINVSRASCGDTLIVRNGTYGDGTATGKLSINGLVCAMFNELTIRAENQRQAKIVDNGTGYALRVRNSAYIVLDGLYVRSTDNNYLPAPSTGELGEVFFIETSHHITARNNISVNPNRYGNNHTYVAFGSQDIIFEDNESYIFSRHCVSAGESERVRVTRQYCNPRGGKIPEGYNYTPLSAGTGDAVMSMYPCKDCILENSIGDGTESPMFLNEQNAIFGGGILVIRNKVLGNICYKCNNGNGITPNARNVADLNHTPQDGLIEHNAFVDWGATGGALKCESCRGYSFNHNTVIATAGSGGGWSFQDNSAGLVGGNTIASFRDNLAVNVDNTGFNVHASYAWTGVSGNNRSYSNGTAFSPTPPSNWGTTYTDDPGFGTCKGLWVPDGSVGKGQGTSGSDIGATILYRYVDGVHTTTPLWDTMTGEFPHGAADPDGINRVAGASIDSIHTRLKVNTGGCSFPAGYGSSGGGAASTVVKGTTAASGLSTTATPLTWNHTITASQDLLLVCVGLHSATASVGSVMGIDVSGQAMSLVLRAESTPAYRAAELWELSAPTSGARTITATLSGTISSALGRSTEYDATAGTQTPVGAGTGTATTLSVTATTNTNELVTDCTVSSKNVTYTHGDNQTGETDLSHSTQALLLAVSHQNGSDGGVMSNATGGAVYQAKVAVSLDASDAPLTAVLTQSDYLFVYPIGTEAGAAPVKSWLTDANAKNLPITAHPNAFVRVRGMIAGSVATTSPFGVALYCRQNADAYTKVMNDEGATTFRLYGASVSADIPSHLAATSNRLCGSSCIPGAVLRDQTAAFTVPALAPGEKIELDSVVQLVGASGTVNCRYQNDNGTAFAVYTNTATMTVVPVASGTP